MTISCLHYTVLNPSRKLFGGSRITNQRSHAYWNWASFIRTTASGCGEELPEHQARMALSFRSANPGNPWMLKIWLSHAIAYVVHEHPPAFTCDELAAYSIPGFVLQEPVPARSRKARGNFLVIAPAAQRTDLRILASSR